ncbi:hypothetical protein M0812_09329 [Anaeramoeba flamelloides]|uniref:E2F/DP family winged-helix DNA-binding domain-containing protein n=1 Tax=Anaeramoeba flamelloides TaxID=1746091 RepID=A0AAV7ZRL2_9EUKA|nr:hypothetical protein M0812_09329 [Anaeramoeba flamelloides]
MFISQHKHKNNPLFQNCVQRIKRLFVQNGIFIQPPQKKTKKLSLKQENDQFYLSCAWYNIFTIDSEKVQVQKQNLMEPTINIDGQNNEKNHSYENPRSRKTIGVLGFKLMKLLKQKSYPRELLSTKTGFSKQRICTVLSIYKLLNLVKVDPKTNFYSWNKEQSLIIPEIQKYLNDLIAARNLREALVQKVLLLSNRLNENLKNKHGHDQRYRQIADSLSTIVQSKVSNSVQKKKTIQGRIKDLKIRQVMRLLQENKKKLREYRKESIKYDSGIEKEIYSIPPKSSSNSKIVLRGRKAIIRKKIGKRSIKKKKNSISQQKQRQIATQMKKYTNPRATIKKYPNSNQENKMYNNNQNFVFNKLKNIDTKIKPEINMQIQNSRILIKFNQNEQTKNLTENKVNDQNQINDQNIINIQNKINDQNKIKNQNTINDQNKIKTNNQKHSIGTNKNLGNQIQDLSFDNTTEFTDFIGINTNNNNITDGNNYGNSYDDALTSNYLDSDSSDSCPSPFYDQIEDTNTFPQILSLIGNDNTDLEWPTLYPQLGSEIRYIPDQFYFNGEW